MVKTVKEVKDMISDLENKENNFLKLQEFFLSHGSLDEQEVKKIKNAIEEGANLNTCIRGLCSDTIRIIREEIDRLNSLIDAASVKI